MPMGKDGYMNIPSDPVQIILTDLPLFINLADTPNDYNLSATDEVRVKITEDGVKFDEEDDIDGGPYNG